MTGTALITGGNGNLGRLVAERLLANGQRVVSFDLPGTTPALITDDEHIIEGDVRDVDALRSAIETHRPDTIYHLASLLSGSSEVDLDVAWAINATASFQLLKLAAELGVEKVFFASTSASYGVIETEPMPADHEQWPESMYGATKVAVERLGVYFKAKHGLDFRCLRFPLVVSPFAPPTAVTAFPSHALKAAAAGESFVFPVSPGTGMSTIFLTDVVDSIVKFTATDRASITKHAYSLHAYPLTAQMVVDAAIARFGSFEHTFEPDPTVEHLLSSWPDVIEDGEARRDWGWDPTYDFEASVDAMLAMIADDS